jgi:diguanylate cyclase (GGDEF)-like protein
MPAAYSHRRALVASALVVYAFVFFAFLEFEVPGLGIGHFYYLAVALLALTGGSRRGIVAGVAADVLYALGIALSPDIPAAEILSPNTGIRLVTFAGMGGLVGWFAAHNRDLVERLQILAERDFLTGLPNTRAFEGAISRRLDAAQPFALLLGDMDRLKAVNDSCGHAAGDDALRGLASMLGASLRPGDEVARVGGDEFAVLTSLRSLGEAAQLCARLESLLATQGGRITFGWALYPAEGLNALSLYRAADERLYARKVVRGQERASGTVLPFPA